MGIVVKMRLQLFNFLIIFTLSNASAAESTNEKPRNSGQCNAQPECLENTENPCFGGNEWLGFSHRQWAEQNCNADWETAFPDPGSVSDWYAYNDYIANHPSLNEDQLIENQPECMEILGESWFGDAGMDDCQFNIKLKDGPVEWITTLSDMEIDQNIQSSGCTPYPYNPSEEGTCYCEIPLSNNFVQVGGHHAAHPRISREVNSEEIGVMDEDCQNIENILIDTGDKLLNINQNSKTMKDHANRNYWQMDCIYCGIRKQMLLQEDALDSNFLYEYTVCLYENYMAKLFHSICAMYDLKSQLGVLSESLKNQKCEILTNEDFCNSDNENGFVDGTCSPPSDCTTRQL